VRTKLCTHFLRFSIFSAIRAPIVAPPSDNFENCSTGWKGLFFRKTRCKLHLNRPTNADAMFCGSNSTICTKAVDGRERYFQKNKFRPLKNIKKQSEKHHTSSSHDTVGLIQYHVSFLASLVRKFSLVINWWTNDFP